MKGTALSETVDTTENTSSNKGRKFAAGGLILLAVAGLGLASASELGLNADDQTFQTGNTTVNTDCQTGPITVSYSDPTESAAAKNAWSVSTVTFSGISAECAGKGYATAYKLDNADNWNYITTATGTGTVKTQTEGDTTYQITVTLPTDLSNLGTNSLTNWSLAIHS